MIKNLLKLYKINLHWKDDENHCYIHGNFCFSRPFQISRIQQELPLGAQNAHKGSNPKTCGGLINCEIIVQTSKTWRYF